MRRVVGPARNRDDESIEALENRNRNAPAPNAHQPTFVAHAPAAPSPPPPSPRAEEAPVERSAWERVRFRDLPVHDPQADYFEVAPPRPFFRHADGSPLMEPRLHRKQRRIERFELFRANPFLSLEYDPNFFLLLLLQAGCGLLALLMCFLFVRRWLSW